MGTKNSKMSKFGLEKKELPAPEETVVENQTKKTTKTKKDKEDNFDEVK